MKRLALTLLLNILFFSVHSQIKADQNISLTYEECIISYQNLERSHPEAKLFDFGLTDIGKPLHLFVINKSGKCNPEDFEKEKAILLINNGIHPGEPCGIDASVKFATDLLMDKNQRKLLDNTIVCIIPVYNVGGSLNRGCCSRANQNGPEEYGFRGNARNLDLNRDFVKRDSENARSFSKIFHAVRPHFFLDTHTSNGADYQYTMTMITSQPNKLADPLSTYVKETVNPAVYDEMKHRGWEMVPYVYMMGRTPEEGIKDYLESPRYSTGYTGLFNSIGFTSETHMFKPFKDRVESTYQYELTVLGFMNRNHDQIIELKEKADQFVKNQESYVLQWELDSSQYETIPFKGYKAEFIKSRLSGQERLKYDRDSPTETSIRYYNTYKPKVKVKAPLAYVIPQAWKEVIERLKENEVEYSTLEKDSTFMVSAYHITDYSSPDKPYEGHYLHSQVKTEKTWEKVSFRKGDLIVYVNQNKNRYIVEMLEPRSSDSFFAWNFFDSMLQQKEWFSDYIFEERALEILEENPEMKKEFELEVKNNPEKMHHWAQLYWIYQRSGFYENTFNRYPIFRIEP